MAPNRPEKGYLYTWNFVDGFLGPPKRRIRFRDVKPTFLHVAYLGGGDRWDKEGTPSGSRLCLILSASARQQQTAQDYNKFYDNYNLKLLSELFHAKAEELSGGGCAWWSIEFDIRGWPSERIDAKIEDVLKWHGSELERIRGIQSTSS
jgi:hypothetical protein